MKDVVPDPVLGVILAGGASRRYGSDKALARLGDRALLGRVIDRVRPQVDALVISGPSRSDFSIPAIMDEQPGQGPLEGVCTVMRWAYARRIKLIATFACDTPFIPADIVARFRGAIMTGQCVVASRGGELQPTCALWRTDALAGLEASLASGRRSLRGAIVSLDAVRVEFPAEERKDPFFNINRVQDMKAAQTWLDRACVPA